MSAFLRVGLPLGLTALALHIATAGRYGYFRDELYFIACAHHPAWGYVDQPPLVALAAWFAEPFGYALLALRILPIFAAALTVALAVEFARFLGGGRFAQWAAGLLTLLLPAHLLLGNTLTTTSFEPLTWMLAMYCALRIVRGGGAWWWVALAAVFAFALYGKYSIALLALSLLGGLLATPARRALATPWFPTAIALTLLLVSPNLAWQAAHGWPIFEVLRNDALHRPTFQNGLAPESRNLLANAGTFAIEQLLYANPLAAPIWIAGIVAPFRVRALRDQRFIAIAAAVVLLGAIALGAKGYYVIGMYGSLLAIGCVWLEHLRPAWRASLLGAALALGAFALPLALPLLPIDALVGYTHALGLTGRGGAPPHLVQPVYAEEFGWNRLARDVARVYDALPPRLRDRATIYADTYADAGALDFFGPRYGLPPAISSQNSYYLWGTNGDDGSTLIAIGATRIDLLRRYYRRVRLIAISREPYRWIVEGPAPIYLCEDPIAPLPVIWPHLRWYGA
ncbi:MAG TPA: glycosyltransferase family 39 protein [Candidatus Tyrphobacter sp.]